MSSKSLNLTRCGALSLLAVTACLRISGSTAAGSVSPSLEPVLQRADAREVISTLVLLKEQADLEQLTAELARRGATSVARHRAIVESLQSMAQATQAPLLAHLDTLRAEGTVESFQPYWLGNIVRVDAQPNVVREVAARPEVDSVYFNAPIQRIAAAPVVHVDAAAASRGEALPGLAAIGIPQVWNALGYTGEGILIAGLDSGVDGAHPALAQRWRGATPDYAQHPEWAWFDPLTHTTTPQDFSDPALSHGTHTTGTMVGGEPGMPVGVAPDAQWIHAAAIRYVEPKQTIAHAMASFEWLMMPTGDPSDTWAVPDVCVNSWGFGDGAGVPACDSALWIFIDNTEQAGIVQIFAAGNGGVAGLTRPADRATDAYRNTAIGAIDPHAPSFPIASFSSVGPTLCTPGGSAAIKPDISAPGVGILSTMIGGGYAAQSGTSMAAPHVAGVVALMRQACPDLPVAEIKQILFDTAIDLGPPGKDNQYGWGVIDAYAAVLAASQCGLSLRLPDGAPNLLSPGYATTFAVQTASVHEQVVPGSERLFWRYDNEAFASIPLNHLSGNDYEAVLPAARCGDMPEFYVRVEGDGGSVRTSPPGAPQQVHHALVGSGMLETVAVLDEHFTDGLPAGWTATGLWHATTSCQSSDECGDGSDVPFLYYGTSATCTYDTAAPNSGTLQSPVIAIPELPSESTATISFCHTLETEPSAPTYDVAEFAIAGGPRMSLGDVPTGATFEFDITPYAGNSLHLEWHFDTVDAQSNAYRGWRIHNVRIDLQMPECSVACPADLTGDGVVSIFDLLQLLAAWGACDHCIEDIDESGSVDVFDLLGLLAGWGPCDIR